MSRQFVRQLAVNARLASGRYAKTPNDRAAGNIPNVFKNIQYEEHTIVDDTVTNSRPQPANKKIVKEIAADMYSAGKTYQKSRRGYAAYTGIEVQENPVPKIKAFNRRILKTLESMPEDYIYRTTVSALIQEQGELVDKHSGDLDMLESLLGQEVEMHIRALKMELRCARNIAEDQPWGELFAPAPTDQWKWPI